MKYDYKTKSFNDEDGRRHKVYGKTDEDAIIKKLQKQEELKQGKAAFTKEKSGILFKTYVKKWQDTYNKNVSQSTRDDIASRLEIHILPYLGHIRMKDITRTDCIDVLNHMEGMSRDRIMKVRQTMKRIFEASYDDGYIIKIPNLRAIDMPDCKEEVPRRAITPYERFLTLKVSEYHHSGAWVLLMLYCGLRPQETAALQGRHINFRTMQITVEEARKTEGNIGETKTQAGKRTVPIPLKLVPYLPKKDPFEFAFTSPKGHPLKKKSMNDMWHSFKREMNIVAGCKVFRNELIPCMDAVQGCRRGCMLLLPEYIRDGIGKRGFPIADDLVPYCYRHTFCTDAVTAGVPIDMLKDLAGHKSISVTAKYYIHMTDERMQQAAGLLNDFHNSQAQRIVK